MFVSKSTFHWSALDSHFSYNTSHRTSNLQTETGSDIRLPQVRYSLLLFVYRRHSISKCRCCVPDVHRRKSSHYALPCSFRWSWRTDSRCAYLVDRRPGHSCHHRIATNLIRCPNSPPQWSVGRQLVQLESWSLLMLSWCAGRGVTQYDMGRTSFHSRVRLLYDLIGIRTAAGWRPVWRPRSRVAALLPL